MAPFRPGAPVTPDVVKGAQQILEKLVEIQNTAAVEVRAGGVREAAAARWG
jgi:hypothetical protein